MHSADKTPPTALTIPFQLRGYPGEVVLRYGANEDPRHWGMQHLRLPVELEVARGFPVLEATIAYEGRGYNAMMGWIQTLDIRSETSGKRYHFLDRFAAFEKTGSPFNAFGHLPTLFDAPVIEALPASIVAGRGETFLAVLPDIGISRTVQALLGFTWGFTVTDQRAGIVSPSRLDAHAWDEALPFLRDQCPDWEFVSGFQ